VNYEDVEVELMTLLAAEAGARPDIPIEAEEFFRELVERFGGSRNDLLAHVRANARRWFTSVGQPPEWIQAEEWPWSGGRPMVFLGQLEVRRATELPFDGSVFLFIDRTTGEVRTVTQQS
jgi:hypothetical protein